CHHIDHVVTQLPYALIVAVISFAGYLVLGFTESVGAGLVTCSALLLFCVMWLKVSAPSP
ncbi:MAG: Na+/H+ antiporter, partial [Shewanella sp.]